MRSGDAPVVGSAGTASADEPPAPAEGTTFYRYHDTHGRLVIVDSISRVPSSARGSVETVVLAPPPEPSIVGGLSAQTLHVPSFAAGAACTLIVCLAAFGLRKAGKPVLRWALLGGVVLLGAGAYLGWLRRMTGHSDGVVSTPAMLIDDARQAVQKMNERTREQQRVLDDLEDQR